MSLLPSPPSNNTTSRPIASFRASDQAELARFDAAAKRLGLERGPFLLKAARRLTDDVFHLSPQPPKSKGDTSPDGK